MAICEMQFFSKSLAKQSMMTVVVPESDQKGPFPVLYLLHGLSDDHNSWARNFALTKALRAVPMIVVCPDGQRSYYCNYPGPCGDQYEDHIVKDVVGFVDSTFQTKPKREGRVIAGLSMGGYGALSLALRHPDVFCGSSSHSGALYFGHQSHPCEEFYPQNLQQMLPHGEYDLFARAEKGKSSGEPMPVIRMDCGVDDYLIETNREFDRHLTSLGIEHEYTELPGNHTWDYWGEHFCRTLEFCKKMMGIPAES